MLAGIEEALHPREPLKVIVAKTAIDTLLAGLVDYAGLYPPASVDVRSAVENYRKYRRGKHAGALGRFIIDLDKVDELRSAAGSLRDLKLSVILAQPADADRLQQLVHDGLPVESVEFKAAIPEHIEQMAGLVSSSLEMYVEVPVDPVLPDLLQAIAAARARVKLRMGGIVASAFPSVAAVARCLDAIMKAGLVFKATAGLHHPIRSRHRLTYAPESPTAVMHGFVNLISAVALLHCGAEVAEAENVLNEQDPAAWRLSPQALSWRSRTFNTDVLCVVREKFVGFGSCSFEEPVRDLESLGWL